MAYEDRVDNYLEWIRSRPDQRKAAIQVIANAQSGALMRLLDDGAWDEDGYGKHPVPGSFDSLEDLESYWSDWDRPVGYVLNVYPDDYETDQYPEAEENPEYKRDLLESWEVERRSYLKRSQLGELEEILQALEVIAELFEIPYSRDLVLETAQSVIDSFPDWDESRC